MYPYVGKKIYFDFYDAGKHIIEVVTPSIQKIEGNLYGKDFKEIVEYKAVIVAKDIYFVYWFEPAEKMLVTEVQNFNKNIVYSNILDLKTSEFNHLKGKMTIMKDAEPSSPTTIKKVSSPLKPV